MDRNVGRDGDKGPTPLPTVARFKRRFDGRSRISRPTPSRTLRAADRSRRGTSGYGRYGPTIEPRPSGGTSADRADPERPRTAGNGPPSANRSRDGRTRTIITYFGTERRSERPRSEGGVQTGTHHRLSDSILACGDGTTGQIYKKNYCSRARVRGFYQDGTTTLNQVL
jgi:hypothetical protein